MNETERETLRQRAMERVRVQYSWDAVTDAYEQLLTGLKKRRRHMASIQYRQ